MKTDNCCICGTTFPVNRKDKKCCSKECSQKLSYLKSRGKGLEKETKICKSCEIDKPATNFYLNKKGSRWEVCKECVFLAKKKQWADALMASEYINIKNCENFIYKIKSQRFWATEADILELIDIYCEIYPDERQKYSGKYDDTEDLFALLFFRMVNWWKIKKEKIIKNL